MDREISKRYRQVATRYLDEKGRFLAVCLVCILSFSSLPVAASEKHLLAQAESTTLRAPYSAQFKRAVDLLNGHTGDSSSLAAAIAELESVLKNNPRYAPAHREMARYFIKKGYIGGLRFQPGSLEAADLSIKKAIEINPTYAEAFVLRGHLYRLMQRPADALAALEKAEKLGTTDPWLQNNWADLLIDAGKYEEAAQRYRNVIDSSASDKNATGSAIEGLIRYYGRVGQHDKVDEMHRKRIALDPNQPWPYGNYAQFLLCVKDDYEKSITRGREALSLMNYGVARYWLAAALYRKWAQSVISGKPDSGKQSFVEAQTLYPDPHAVAARASTCPSLKLVADALARNNK